MSEGCDVPVVWADAFTDQPFGGNPAAVCLLERAGPSPAMRSAAFEFGLSEIALVWPEGQACGLRWLTPTTEVFLCGHATVATAHALRAAGRIEDAVEVVSRTRSGPRPFVAERVEIDPPAVEPSPVAPPPASAERWPIVATAGPADVRDVCAIDETVSPTDAAAGTGRSHDAGAGASHLRRLVEAHAPGDDRESASKERFVAELRRLRHPCDREADPVHVTASAVVCGRRGIVLHLHRRIGRWLQPGGHVDPGEAPEDAVLREVREETGLHASHPSGGPHLVHLDVHDAPLGHVHLDMRYLLVAPDVDPVPLDGESPHVRWFAWPDAERVADVAFVGALRAARAAWEKLPKGTAEGVPADGR